MFVTQCGVQCLEFKESQDFVRNPSYDRIGRRVSLHVSGVGNHRLSNGESRLWKSWLMTLMACFGLFKRHDSYRCEFGDNCPIADGECVGLQVYDFDGCS